LKINIPDAIRFLDYLGGHDKNFHYQTYDDKKDSRTATVEEGSFNELIIDRLITNNKHGGGVFVAINTHKIGSRRTKKTTESINAVFVDFDDIDTAKSRVEEATKILPATVTVESSNGKFHMYWILENPGVIPVNDFSIWQKMLASLFHSDAKIIDSSRVMRLPGFVHQKGEPFLTRIVDEFSFNIKYSLDKLVATFYGGRNCWLTSIAGRYRSDGLPGPEIQTFLNYYNSQLSEPLDDSEIETICQSMGRYDPDPSKLVVYQASVEAGKMGLEVDKMGRIIPHDRNALKVVQHNAPVRYNVFSQSHEVITPVPWSRGTHSPQWEDSDTNSFKHYLNNKYDCDWPITHINSAVDHVSMSNIYDPLIDYLNSLEWDGKNRIKTVFQRFLGVTNSEYTIAVAECMFVGAIRRAFEPGCKFDYMVVFVGEEGGGKSKFGEIIAKYNEFFTDSVGDIRNKDGVVGMMGKWIVEFQELRSLQGVSAEHTKAFISTQADNVRLPYEKRSRIFPRRNIFIGSTNNDKFITDVGANRRILPIYTPKSEEKGDVMDYRSLRLEVDQLWAEAIHMYKNGHNSQMPSAVMEVMNVQRLLSTESGEYELEIISYMEDDKGYMINGNKSRRLEFSAKNFYMQTDGANRIAWGNYGSAIQNRVNNAAKKVFSLPEWSKYKHGRYSTNGIIWRGWKLVE